MTFKNATYLGHVAVFYIPTLKLSRENHFTLTSFLVDKYDAYTHEASDIQGYWRDGPLLVNDRHERFEVSFAGKDRVQELIDFLAQFCAMIGEKCIYLTMGYKAWLVLSK